MRLLLALSCCASVVACSHHHSATGDDDDGGADASNSVACGSDADCGSDEHCDLGSHTCIGGCGGQHLDLTYVPPNLGIVLDRSCSMTNDLQGTQTTKWQAAVAALNDVLGSYATDLRWGLTLFPDTTGNKCTQDAIPFPIADGNGPPISALLTASLQSTDPNYPDNPCVTDIDSGIEMAATDPALTQTDRKSFLMLVTDGAQSGCSAGGGTSGAEAAVTSLFAAGVATYVVGFGSEVDGNELTKLANDGGVPSTGATAYYQADTAAELDTLFQQIASDVVSCSYTVNQSPPDLDETYVIYSGNTLVPRDTTHMMGWDYDPASMTLTVYGSYCTELKTHVVTQVDVVFGCPSPPIQ